VILFAALLLAAVALMFLLPAWVATLIERTPGRRRCLVVPALLAGLAATGLAGIHVFDTLVGSFVVGPNTADYLESHPQPNYASGWLALGFVAVATLALRVAVAVTRRQRPSRKERPRTRT
jgi:MFS family permease